MSSSYFRFTTLLAAIAMASPAGAASPKEDRGEASMKVGGQVWHAARTHAVVRDDRLSISATRTDRTGGAKRRETLRLVVKGYAGPGEYDATASSSFTRIGLDTKAMTAAEGDQEATNKVVTDLLKKSEVTLLRAAKITITSANAREIHGTFIPPKMSIGEKITEGRFRALVRKRRKRTGKRRRGVTPDGD